MSELPVTEPGIYEGIAEHDYHSDPCSVPSLSSSIAKILLTRSPRHAYMAHPRLNKALALEAETSTRAQNFGSAVHKAILGEGKAIKVLNFDDYKKKDAQIARDAARAAGLVPILADEWERVETVARTVRAELVGTELEGIFDAGKPEVTIVWRDIGGITCRARFDFLPDNVRYGGFVIVPDIKTTANSAEADVWRRTSFDMGADIQAAFYERGLRTLIPSIRDMKFMFAVAEQEAPHGVNVFTMGGEAMEKAREYVDHAMRMWAACTASGSWPGYPKETVYLDPPVYHAMAMELRRLTMLQRIAKWQAPLEIDGAPETRAAAAQAAE